MNIDFLEKSVFFRQRWLQHIAFWLAFFIFELISQPLYFVPLEVRFVFYGIQLPAILLPAYINLYSLIPHFLLKRKFLFYLIFFLIFSLLGAEWSRRLILFGMEYVEPDLHTMTPVPYYNYGGLFYTIGSVITVMTATTMIKTLKLWYKKEHLAERLQKEKQEAELKFLKNQINPHFLFNTLNNIYALTLRQSKEAPNMVLKLSAMLDYLIYDSNVVEISLKKEIECLQNYLSIEKMRYGDRLNLSFHIRGNYKESYIAPILLLPLVENSFKHGMDDEIGEGWISLDLEVSPELICFKVENTKANSFKKKKGGIGLKNLRKRLALIYGKKHQIQIFDGEDVFLVILKIWK